ncbi:MULTISPECIES: hypothetical protein [unclassified Sulfitobacter]|uniref:hypothetical protein n=1 Tax=unclassified Sulfitobacter TaxID=196795 RepID=UPI0023E24063|nr:MULTISPECIES: hypothetical protein [unclassified Sulfitobacter]MDF3382557.1 site-specific integrase [Sulfitobacter sp. Ks11]MDF3385976.1 site-specific integrase [Sulfitobacter sp. M85]MDF3389395.1 site-specific integrase [Sulfitobacter sp. Ks16]MDF3400032.1 site-specific integrase [Sulfitobacter sp. KE39]MDF3403453.1 site-specific integrase [Sulfitobacter sp. Ks35]
MAKPSAPRPSEVGSHLAELDEYRRSQWLQSDYSASVWTVADTHDANKTALINFNYRLADGRNLINADRLYATVKEYAWWLRDPRYSKIDDASTHATMVQSLMHLAHALSLRNIWSFAHLQPYDIEQLTEEIRYGADAVLRASERVEAYLESLRAANALKPKLFGGLPRYVIPTTGARTKIVHVDPIMAACGLPSNAKVLPRVAALIGREAKRNGLKKRNGAKLKPLRPLSNVTSQSMQRWLAPLEDLYIMRRRIAADGISFKPFPHGAARVAAVKGVGTERTPTPPPKLVLYLLEHSVRWICEDRSTEPTTRSEILLDVAACWVLIAAFSARRDEEIDDLRNGCLRGDDESGWWLQIYIEKTLQRKEWIPVPGLVARAIRKLEQISFSARQQTGTDHLFQWRSPLGNIFRLDVGRQLDEFAAAINVPQHQIPGKPPFDWHWHPHQFRRFFAILYFYRFEGATIEALSHHLRHFNLEMTRQYLTQDPEAAALWTDVEWGYMGHVARTIVAGERVVSGAAGERMKKTTRRLNDAFRRKLHVTSSERVGASLSTIMQRRGLVLRPKPWVTCTCPRTYVATSQAACRRSSPRQTDEVGPNFAAAGPSVCPSCPHAMIEGGRKPFIEEEIGYLEAVSETKPRGGTLFGELEQARLLELFEVKRTRYDHAQPLGDPASDKE